MIIALITWRSELIAMSLILYAIFFLDSILLAIRSSNLKGYVERVNPPSRIIMGSAGRMKIRTRIKDLNKIRVFVKDLLPENIVVTNGKNEAEIKGDAFSFNYEFKPIYRGVHALGPLMVYARSNFDLSRYVLRLPPSIIEVEAVPRFYAHILTPPAASYKSASPGGHPTKIKGYGYDFWGLREYLPGDDVRLIHWRSSARNPKGIPLIREVSAEATYDVFVVIDPSPSTSLEYLRGRRVIDDMVDAAGEIIVQCMRLGDPVGLHISGLPALTVPVTRRKEHIQIALKALETLNPSNEPILYALPNVAGRVLKRGSIIIILSTLDTIRLKELLFIIDFLKSMNHKVIVVIPYLPAYVRLTKHLRRALNQEILKEINRVKHIASVLRSRRVEISVHGPRSYVYGALKSYLTLRGVSGVRIEEN
jgi:uncharacterized protein (DUF58 family)